MTDDTKSAGSLETPADVGLSPSGVHKRWMLEIKLADKQEADWRKSAKEAIDIYEGEKEKAFNILWANTETLRPALYNSLPQPDVRKRWEKADKAGDIASDMLERSLVYSLDAYGADSVFKLNTLDACLQGRAIARVRYIPALSEQDSNDEGQQFEELVGEQCVCEHVQWDDFRRGPGKTWDEVSWIAFRHRMTRSQLVEKFPEVGQSVELDAVADDDVKKCDDEGVVSVFKTAEVWELWDKDERKVLFLASNYKAGPLKEVADPLELQGFFPIPEPMRAIEKASSLVPVTPYTLYKKQAEELNTISSRIIAITKVLKYRGVYDSTLDEMSKLKDAGDNEFIAVTNSIAWTEKGGLEKAIMVMPIESAAKVLIALESQRESCKQTIYELTGISDIVRGASNAQETATAQQIKAQFGTLRLQRFQQEVQRYIRDIIRLMAEVIAEKFQPQTLMQMSGIMVPTQAEVALQMQQAFAQAMAAGQQPPPMPKVVTLEEVLQILRSDIQRAYRVDIETDSTIQAMEGADQKAVADLIQGIGVMAQSLGTAVQAGLFPAQAAQAITKAVVRKFKLGRAVEDALDEEPPQQGMPPEVQKAMEEVQAKAQEVEQGAQQLEQQRMGLEHKKAMDDLKLENDRLKFEHQQAMADVQQKQAGGELMLQVREALAQHKAEMQALMQPRASDAGV